MFRSETEFNRDSLPMQPRPACTSVNKKIAKSNPKQKNIRKPLNFSHPSQKQKR